MEKNRINEFLLYFRENGCPSIDHSDSIENDTGFIVPAECIRKIVAEFVEHFSIYHLTTITAQQRNGFDNQIEVIYHFWNGASISIHTFINRTSPELPSIIDLIPGADFYEREVAEMYGVKILNRPDIPHLLLPDQWNAPPPMLNLEG